MKCSVIDFNRFRMCYLNTTEFRHHMKEKNRSKIVEYQSNDCPFGAEILFHIIHLS